MVRTVVADASILIKWVLPRGTEPDQVAAYALRNAVMTGKVEVKLPSLWIYEVGNTLGRLYPDYAENMLESLLMLGLTECDWDLRWLRQALVLMRDHKVSFYDAAYHGLALVEKGIFVTADSEYVRKVAGAKAVTLLRDWRC